MKRQKERGFRGWVSNAIAAGLFSLVAACGGGGAGQQAPDVAVPNDPPRQDLSYAYYGADSAQLDETYRHVTHHFIPFWYGPDWAENEAVRTQAMGLKIILALRDPYTDAALEATMDALLTRYEARGIRHIEIIYPHDEPNLSGLSDVTVSVGNDTIRKVMARHASTRSTLLMSIYAPGKNLPGLSSFDLAGYDNYDARENTLTNGEYSAFQARLNFDPARGRVQGQVLVVGGADRWHQDPAAFILRAQNDKRVQMVMPFLWLDNADPANGARGAGIRSNGLAPAYCAWGVKIKYPNIAIPC